MTPLSLADAACLSVGHLAGGGLLVASGLFSITPDHSTNTKATA